MPFTPFKQLYSADDRGESDVATNLLVSNSQPMRVFPRKGGGGGGRGGGGRSSSGKGGSSGGKGKPPSANKGAPASFTNSKSAQPFGLSFGGKGKKTATAYGDGGGKRFTFGSGSGFAGREAGGGTRNQVYGTSRFGSGYPYGGYGTYANQRPMPFVFYPVPVSHGYYGGDEYLNASDRPGGPLVSAIIKPSYNTSSVTYRIVADNTSVTTVFDALVANCSVSSLFGGVSPISPFAPSPSAYPLPEQIVQYYRASSFALALDGYNNTAASLSNMPKTNDSAPVPPGMDVPLPQGLNMTFLACLNSTIAASVPLVDPDAAKKLTSGEIAGIVIGGLLGVFVLIVVGIGIWQKCVIWREKKLEHEGFRKRFQLFWATRVGYRAVKA